MQIIANLQQGRDLEIKTNPPICSTALPRTVYKDIPDFDEENISLNDDLRNTAEELYGMIEQYEGICSGLRMDHFACLNTNLNSF